MLARLANLLAFLSLGAVGAAVGLAVGLPLLGFGLTEELWIIILALGTFGFGAPAILDLLGVQVDIGF